MNIEDLRRRAAILEAVRLDLSKWRIGESVPFNERPVVAVDWSEIFCYIFCQPPQEDGTADDFAAHYAGLNYLFFGLPCRLVLLPPYEMEMKYALENLKTQALAVPLTADFGKKYPELLSALDNLGKKYASFDAIVKNRKADWSALDELPDDAWELLETVLKDYLPRIYLDVQERTSDATQALRLVRSAKDDGNLRLQLLSRMNAISLEACNGAVGGWDDWSAEMDLQRPKLERQNRADAMALAYLQAIHQAFYWHGIPVFFASRSLSMLDIMENHAGEFEPYFRSDVDTTNAIRSSWRPWDYFAELGYYCSKRSVTGTGGAVGDEIRVELTQRRGKLNQRIATFGRERHGEGHVDASETFYGWETLRGSFDLEGMGDQDHWRKIKKPKESRLANLLRSVLSANDWGAFLEKRGKLANDILKEIDEILDTMPSDVAVWANSELDPGGRQTIATLTQIVVNHLDLPNLFAGSLRASLDSDDSALADEIISTLKGITNPSSNERTISVHKLLITINEREAKGKINLPSRDWLTGTALFFSNLLAESLSYLSSWVEAQTAQSSPNLDLATRALCAEASRQRVRDYEIAMRFLLGVPNAKAAGLNESEVLVWHCLKAQLLTDWMEPCGESFQVFPKISGEGGEEEVVGPMAIHLGLFLAREAGSHGALKVRAANILLYLAARFIPEDVRSFSAEERERKLGWLKVRKDTFQDIELWFREVATSELQASYFLTLGYYNIKMYLYSGERYREGDGLNYLRDAEHRAARKSDRKLERRLAELFKWFKFRKETT